MRVLHCFGIMNRGGAETMLMNLYRNIDRNKYTFLFFVNTDKKGDYDEEIIRLGGEIYSIKSLGKVGLIKYIMNFRRTIMQISPIDIIHIHMDWQCGYIALAAYLAGIKNIVVHNHTSGMSNAKSKIKQLALFISKRLISIFSKERVACSKEAGDYLYVDKKYKILSNAIDYNNFSIHTDLSRKKARKKLNINDNDVLMCHVGSFSKNKNQMFLVHVVNKLIKVDKRYKLILIGRGKDYYKKVEEYVVNHDLIKYVQLLGVQEDIPWYLNASDIFLFPSKREGFGMAVVEAQAAGLSCIISDSVPRTVDINLGLTTFIETDNINKWINIIRTSKKLHVCKSDIQKALKDHSLEINNQVNLLENLYQSMLN